MAGLQPQLHKLASQRVQYPKLSASPVGYHVGAAAMSCPRVDPVLLNSDADSRFQFTYTFEREEAAKTRVAAYLERKGLQEADKAARTQEREAREQRELEAREAADKERQLAAEAARQHAKDVRERTEAAERQPAEAAAATPKLAAEAQRWQSGAAQAAQPQLGQPLVFQPGQQPVQPPAQQIYQNPVERPPQQQQRPQQQQTPQQRQTLDSFTGVTGCRAAEKAQQLLACVNWDLNRAIALYYDCAENIDQALQRQRQQPAGAQPKPQQQMQQQVQQPATSRITFSLPQCGTCVGEFKPTDTLWEVYTFVAMKLEGKTFTLVIPNPRTVLTEDKLNQTIAEAGLVGDRHLQVMLGILRK